MMHWLVRFMSGYGRHVTGLILPAPDQKDGWMGGASFDTKNVLGVKPNLNIQRLPDLLPLSLCQTDGWKHHASWDVENVLGAKLKRWYVGSLDGDRFVSNM